MFHLRLTGLLILALAFLPACVSAATADTKTVRPQILRILNHDPEAFTQGLVFHAGRLYESTGLYGHSSLRVLDPTSGALILKKAWEPELFAEGLAAYQGALYLLSWKQGKLFRITLPGYARTTVKRYKGEGWGLAAFGQGLVMSNGSDTLVYLDSILEPGKRLPVRLGTRKIGKLNELEAARGLLYANIWYEDYIVEIDPETGQVLRLIDCSELRRRAAPTSADDVLNGIAYRQESNSFFLTGKRWKFIFEVHIPLH